MVTKTGTSGNDTLYGGPGGDELIGLAGNDTYGVYSQFDTVVEKPGEGNDRVLTFASYVLASGASIETLSTAINTGTDSIQLTGNEISQFIIGNFGANTIDGRGGGDAMVGLAGNDTYYVSGRTDFVIENANEGVDTVYVRGDYILNAGSSVEAIGVANPATRTSLLIGGNEQVQSISGGSGADTINGGGGADTLSGGLGDDTYRLFGGETVNEIFGGGYDRVFTSATFAAPSPITLPTWGSYRTQPLASEIEFISTAVNAGTESINLTGSRIAQTIIGNYGNNILDGYFGADTLIGLFGDDVYRVYGNGEVIVENAGQGNDAVFASGTSYSLAAGVSVETLSSSDNGLRLSINLTGNEFAQSVIGDYGNNVLDGGGGNDTVYGLLGDDVFLFTTAPGAGNIDTLGDFGTGADRIRLDLNRFSGLTAGTLASSAIALGAVATDGDDRIIYNPSTGSLSFDSDGTGSAAAVQFAVLPTGLAASQIIVDVDNGTSISNASGVVTLPDANTTVRVGGATGFGTDLASAYPNATSFVIGNNSLPGAQTNIVFGPNSLQVPITFAYGLAVGAFDFSQLATALRLTSTSDFLTAGGQTIIQYPSYSYSLTFARPTEITGTRFDDYIDGSLRLNGQVAFDEGYGPNLRGGDGNDTLINGYLVDGGAGDDIIISPRNGVLVGGAGADTFRIGVDVRWVGYQRAPNLLLDFNPLEDKIELISYTYQNQSSSNGLVAGPLPASQFTNIPLSAWSGAETIFYDKATGDLSIYTGNQGPAGLWEFARLPAGLDLTAANFTVVGP